MLYRFEDAAFLQDLILHDINKGGYFARLCDGFQEERYLTMPPGTVRSVIGHTMLRADPIYVSDDVMTLWEYAAKTFKLEVVTRGDLVVPAGFALFPRPFEMRDIHDKLVRYRAMAWLPISTSESHSWDEGVEGQGVWVTLLSNVNDIDDYWEESHYTKDGVSGALIRDLSIAAGHEWSLMHASPMIFDQPLDEAVVVGADGKPLPANVIGKASEIYGHIQCFWRLMSQLVVVPDEHRLPRQARRQRQRENRVNTVKVLKLRRPKPKHREHDGESTVNWSHRWPVEGHWRAQPYGPRAKPHYKQIWIDTHIKGPEDAPLVIKRRGVHFTR